jgi:membrane-associated HD superfamily phosphohydrolase
MKKLIEETLSEHRIPLAGLTYPGVRAEDIEEFVKLANKKIRQSDIPEELKELSVRIYYIFARPTSIVDRKKTEEARKKKRDSIQPIKRLIQKGEIIIRNGEIVRKEHVNILKKLHEIEKNWRPWSRFWGTLLFSLVITLIIIYYINNFKKEIVFS